MRSPSFWYQPKPTTSAQLLLPISWLYATGARIHGWWRKNHAWHAPVPVISVGNLTIGGTGKTPLVSWLAEQFSHTRRVAIISRGYGGTTTFPTQVNATGHTAENVGDEPLMMAHQLHRYGVQIWIGKDRPATAKAALAAGAQLLLLDDGFQRRDIHRDINILVINGPQGFGNRLPLPAGPLREFPSAQERTDLTVVMNPPPQSQETYPSPIFPLSLQSDVSHLPNGPWVAFTGIAHPSKFFDSLTKQGLKLSNTVPYPDHHSFTPKDLKHLQTLAASHDAGLLCSAKDAVKLPADFPTYVAPLILSGPALPNLLSTINKMLPQTV